MDSWRLIFEDDSELKESDCGIWDAVPKEKKIKKVIFYFLNGYTIEFEKFSNICISKLGWRALNGESCEHIGYVITVVYDNFGMFINYRITNEGVKCEVDQILNLTVPEQFFRDGEE